MLGSRVGSTGAFLGSTVGSDADDEGGTTTPLWTIDTGKAFPADATEWAAFLASDASLSNWSVPDWLWLCQVASGNLVCVITGLALVPNATPTYEQTFGSFTRKGVGFVDNTGNQRFRSLDASLPNVASESFYVMADIAVTNNPAGPRSVFGAGLTGLDARCTTGVTASALMRAVASTTATGATEMGFGVRPWIGGINRAAGTAPLYSNVEKLLPTFGTRTGIRLDIGSVGASPPAMVVGYIAAWRGTKAERSDADVSAMMSARGYTVSGW